MGELRTVSVRNSPILVLPGRSCLTSPVRCAAMPANLLEVEPLLVDQYGLVTRDQMLSRGLTPRDIDGLLRRRVIRRVRRGVYVVVGTPQSWEQSLLAAVLAAREGARGSHASSAQLWAFRNFDEDEMDLVVVGRTYTSVPGARVHRTVWLPEVDQDVVRDIPCTSFERTLCDVTSLVGWFQAGQILDDGLRRGVANLDRLRECAQQLDSGPNRRLTVIDALLRQREPGFDPGGSGAEIHLLNLLREAGLPEPVQQYRVRLRGKTYFLDFAWPEANLFAEWYGTPWHIGASAVMYDNTRLTDLARADWRPMIFTEASTDAEIVETVREMLEKVGRVTH